MQPRRERRVSDDERPRTRVFPGTGKDRCGRGEEEIIARIVNDGEKRGGREEQEYLRIKCGKITLQRLRS